MGCVSSHLLDRDDEFSQLGHHIVSLTSTTYGLLTIDPPTPPPRFTLTTEPPSRPEPVFRSEPEIINSWELMAGLDTDSSRFSPSPHPIKPSVSLLHTVAELDSRISRPPPPPPKCKENQNPNLMNRPVRTSGVTDRCNVLKLVNANIPTPRRSSVKYRSEDFEKCCPPKGEHRVVLYSTTLRGVRKTFEACNSVRSVLEGLGVVLNERDVSMHNGYREELKILLGNGGKIVIPPRVFIKGRYIGGAEEVLRIHEEGCLGELVDGLPKIKCGVVCEGCGGVGFLPCFECSGSCKVVVVVKGEEGRRGVMRCSRCNENGLVLCPICS